VASDNGLIVGIWKMTARQKISGKDGTLLQNEVVTGCDTLRAYNYTNKGIFIFTDSRKTASGECERLEGRDDRWTYTYNTVSKTLFLIENESQDKIEFHVSVLTATEMQFKKEISDDNQDGVKDFELTIFNK